MKNRFAKPFIAISLALYALASTDVVFAALSTNIISYWKLDGNSTDSVSTNNGVDTTVTYSLANGKINQGAGLGGSGYINVGNSSALVPANISITAWIKLGSTGTYQAVFSRDDPNTGGNNRSYQFRVNNTNHIECIPFNSTTNGLLAGNTALSSGVWYFVSCTWDGTNINVYVNGAADATPSAFAGPMRTAGTNNTYIGADLTGAGGTINNKFSGAIDEVGIWSRALSASEESQLYNSGNGLQYPFVTSTPFNWAWWQDF